MSMQTWFARHAQTLLGSLGRLTQQPIATLMTMAVIAIALALPLLLNVILQNTLNATANWSQSFDLSVYLDKRIAAGRPQTLAKLLKARAEVAEVRLITADAALAQFRAESGFGSALDALSDNPLPDTLIVTPTIASSSAENLEALKNAIAALPDVQAVQLDTEWVKRLHALMDVLKRVVWLTGAALGLGVILVVGNTIRLDILNRRTEIEVMKLVGATDGFARRPFLYSGFWYGLGGGSVAWVLVSVAVLLLATPVQRMASLYGSQFQLRGLGLGSGLLLLAIASGLGWLGSWAAATRHIRGIEPT